MKFLVKNVTCVKKALNKKTCEIAFFKSMNWKEITIQDIKFDCLSDKCLECENFILHLRNIDDNSFHYNSVLQFNLNNVAVSG